MSGGVILASNTVLQFKISLQGIRPVIWRRIQISNTCSFWGLHVAIQNAMGWEDKHLHLFTLSEPVNHGRQHFGIPDYDGIDSFITFPGWEYKVKDYLVMNDTFKYEYDFGDGWMHFIEYEGQQPKQSGLKYPICLSGERACPPEDIGGVHGYEYFIEVISNPEDPEYEHMLNWLGRVYKPDVFNPKEVRFESPLKRWRQVFE